MRRRKDVPGTLYLLCFAHDPLKHATHYLGWCGNGRLEERVEEHRNGSGAKIMRAVRDAGIEFVIAKTWPGTRNDERRLKKHGKSRICPICSPHLKESES